MKTSEFDYHLPPEFIAQTPVEPREQSQLMVLHRKTNLIEHRSFRDIIEYFENGDTLVFNDSRVIPARLVSKRGESNIEVLLLRQIKNSIWEALVRPGKKARIGSKIIIAAEASIAKQEMVIEILEQQADGIRLVHISDEALLEKLGRIPLPPYIRMPLAEPERYQTVYARVKGSVAAPTAGLHFTPRLLLELQQKGINLAFVTLHIGLDTFRPIRIEDPSQHPIHKEYGEISTKVAKLLNATKRAGKHIITVGTSTTRLVEAASQSGAVQPFSGWVDLFILPGYQFRIVDALVTNFHLPKSTLLMLVSAFASREFILQAYEVAKNLRYRFYSFGDAMLIL